MELIQENKLFTHRHTGKSAIQCSFGTLYFSVEGKGTQDFKISLFYCSNTIVPADD